MGGLHLDIPEVVHGGKGLGVRADDKADRGVHDGGGGKRKEVLVVIELGTGPDNPRLDE
jgi:hypothetical protein